MVKITSLLYSPFWNLKNSQLRFNVIWHDACCQQHDEIYKIKSILNNQMPYPKYKTNDDSIDLESKPFCLANISIDDIDNEINDSCPLNHVTNTTNIEHYDLWSNFVIQSCNGSNQKS